ncbi:unnamed protein product [Clonostachys rosea]|uniref:Major facilitator superfamily (MFS) profile domain-containing protein n=1 Tax=Bionectria ochroleuca TaxID=29856 RepID=A0ABY6URH8_BIOOC|nr:unnamed protein product [Clonostachys rosea]
MATETSEACAPGTASAKPTFDHSENKAGSDEVVISTAIGDMLFGYDSGVISGVLVVLGDDLDGRITADRYGRKPAIWFASILFTIGALIQATSYTIAQMSAGRILVGLGVGSASMIIPLYIAEISPAKYRGRMISIDMIFLGTGSLLAYAFNAAFGKVPHGWRYIVGLGGTSSIILGVLLIWCPESPRQLMFHGKVEECTTVVKRMYPKATQQQIDQLIAHIQLGVAESKARNEEISSFQAFKTICTVPSTRRATIVAACLMAIRQLCGFNTLMYYSITLFQIVGFRDPIAVGTVVAGTNWLMTFLSIFLIDRIGRRRLLLWSMWGMPTFLVVAAIVFRWIPLDRDTLELTTDEVGWPAIIVLVSMILFVAFYAAGLGCVPWQTNELLPLEVRAIGTALINVVLWASNIIVSSTFLSMMRGISPSGTFGFYAALSLSGYLFVIFCYPEASGMTLEEVRNVFEHGFGVRYAEEWRKQNKAGLVQHGNSDTLAMKIRDEEA